MVLTLCVYGRDVVFRHPDSRVLERWEALVRRLMPSVGSFTSTISFSQGDYPARRPAAGILNFYLI